MEETRERKSELREEALGRLAALDPGQIAEKVKAIEERLFEFANFLESRIVLFYTPAPGEVDTTEILRRSVMYNKIIVLPLFLPDQDPAVRLYKVDDIQKDLVKGTRGNLEPNPKRCKSVPLDCLDIAIVPGLVMDEKGGRIGTGHGSFDQLIPELPATTRKVGLVFESRIVPAVPMESHDKYLDIIITETRIIYKI
ncbi:5-formyltetrahydrofolate cyclo-ligase [Desulfatitalea alkaliphila]|uniref:5-formyltetrahydrofolate cyclo-ligase n=1 Tax=Desulfatitalea alkaliphila TaxID=2929485 RepID=A0AA41R598_9BACT|nr:5-formyltetrahydrofolate cyclo-ligase [Desulfatitalea alkaliphila]MCJ8502086.1 5-formyltetrahydrofolate cyclo-ligase [Desulfatitalea alkaliphila]